MQLGKVGRVKAYQRAVLTEWLKWGQLCQKIAAFSSRVDWLGSKAWGDSELTAGTRSGRSSRLTVRDG